MEPKVWSRCTKRKKKRKKNRWKTNGKEWEWERWLEMASIEWVVSTKGNITNVGPSQWLCALSCFWHWDSLALMWRIDLFIKMKLQTYVGINCSAKYNIPMCNPLRSKVETNVPIDSQPIERVVVVVVVVVVVFIVWFVAESTFFVESMAKCICIQWLYHNLISLKNTLGYYPIGIDWTNLRQSSNSTMLLSVCIHTEITCVPYSICNYRNSPKYHCHCNLNLIFHFALNKFAICSDLI